MSSGKPIAALLAVVCLAQCSRDSGHSRQGANALATTPAVTASEPAPAVAIGLPEIDPSLPTQERIAVALRSVQQGLDEILEACGVDAEVALSADALKASFQTQEFQVHLPWKTGKIPAKLHAMTGPNYKGLLKP